MHPLPLRCSFNSRTPGGVRPDGSQQPCRTSQVSIHAPREGCDSIATSLLLLVDMFQFTHPGRGATCTTCEQVPRRAFQFTHPGRGATSPLYAVR